LETGAISRRRITTTLLLRRSGGAVELRGGDVPADSLADALTTGTLTRRHSWHIAQQQP
jgi:hypothetical protein